MVATRTNKYTTIPKKGKSDPQFDAIAANLELLTGQKGQGGKRAVLVEDLQELGIIGFNQGRLSLGSNVGGGGGTGGGGGVTPPTPPVIQPPTIPTGFSAVGGFQYVSFTWDAVTYTGHSYTEIWVSQTDNFSMAVRVGVTPATVFGYSVNYGWQGYAWIRHVNQSGAVGPLNDTNGTFVTTSTDISDLLDNLKGTIGQDYLAPDMDKIVEDLNDSVGDIDRIIADGMLEEAVTQDVYSVERRVNQLTLRATIERDYYTGVDTDKAIAAATTQLKAEIEDPDGTSIGADLVQRYYTKATTDEAIAAATTTLKSDIENPEGTSLGAELANNYYTKTATDSAIATATTTLRAELEDPDGNSLGASLEETKSALAQTDGYQQALWGVKASAGDITASIGLVAKSDPNNPNINNAYFYVLDADMRVGYTVDTSTGEEKVTPIFGTIDDPDNPGKKILAIDSTAIKVANINELVAGSIVADSIVSNSTITSPSIVGGNITIGNNFAVDGAGNMTFNNFTGQNGSLTGRLDVGAAFISGANSPLTNHFISSNNGNFYIRHDGYLYAKNGYFEGTVQANNIIGDLVSARNLSLSGSSMGGWVTVASFSGRNNNTQTATLAVTGGAASTRAYRPASGGSGTHTASATFEIRTGINGSYTSIRTTLRRSDTRNASITVTGSMIPPGNARSVSAGANFSGLIQVRIAGASSGTSGTITSSGAAIAMLFRDGGAFN